jgi:AcrR family transcriptional regulator
VAREKVENKYRAILDAAIAVFAERGFWDTPTSLISRTAGVADGTLFNYFKTKDDLINEVYLEAKRELAREMLKGFPANASLEEKMRHIWNQYIAWGVEHPDKFKVLHQIGTSYELSDEVKAQGTEPFAEIGHVAGECIAQGVFRDYPVEYLGALLESQAIMTVQFASENRDKLSYFQKIGFDILWRGITQ